MGRAPCCDKANVKRGPWSPEEDAVLKTYIETNGTGGNWITLPQRAGLKRCGKSCRLRWLNYLRPEIKHGGFSVEEDAIICALFRALGSRWSVIASRLPGRTDNDVKNYWNTKLKKRYSAQQQKPAAEETRVSVECAARTTAAASTPAATAAVPAFSTIPPSLPKLLPTTSGCSYPYLPPVDYSNFCQTAPNTSPLLYRRPPSFMSTSIEGSYVVTPRSQDDVSSSAPSGTPSSSLTADYSGASGPLAFGSTTIDNYMLTTPLDLEDASTTSGATATATSSSSLTMDSSGGGGGGCQPWPVADEYFFAEAEAAFESYYFSSSSSSSSANLAGLPGAGGAYNWTSGAGDSGLLWDVVVDSSYS